MSLRKWLRRRGAFLAAVLVCGSFGFMPGLTGRASAVVLLPSGSSVTLPGSFAYPPGAFDSSESDSFTSANGLFTGALTTSIFTDSVTGDLDFVYQLFNKTTGQADSFDRLTLSSFSAFSTDVDYSPLGTDIAPIEADRVFGTVGFNFAGNSLAPNDASDYLIIKTNSLVPGLGSGQIVDGDSALATIAVPFAYSVPEPASLSLLVIGGGMVLARRRRPSRN